MVSILKYCKKNQAGDTIVEVLIATAVIGTLLATSFGVISQNRKASTDVQEHMNAQKLLETQVELLRQAKGMPADGSTCLLSANNGGAGNECQTRQGGALYTISITKISETYKVNINWQTIKSATANETVYYKVPI